MITKNHREIISRLEICNGKTPYLFLFLNPYRILYGKMRSKTGMGKVGAGVRQSIVLRFLNGCTEDELQIFIDLVFKPFQGFISGMYVSRILLSVLCVNMF